MLGSLTAPLLPATPGRLPADPVCSTSCRMPAALLLSGMPVCWACCCMLFNVIAASGVSIALQALNVSRTRFGDALLEDLTYGLRLVAWTATAGGSLSDCLPETSSESCPEHAPSAASTSHHLHCCPPAGQSVPPELAGWPCSRLQRLRMRHCAGVTPQGLRCLELLPDLRFLDAR